MPAQVPYPTRGHRAEPVALGDREPDQGLRHLAHQRVHLRCDLHRFPESVPRSESSVSRSALGYTNPGIYHSGLDQIPSMTGWGNGPTLFNPGGFDPVLFATKWLISGAQNVTKVAGAHTMKAGVVLRVGEQQPARQRRLERPARARQCRGRFERQLFRRPPDRHPRQLRRAVAEHRPRHGLQHLRGVRAGQLEERRIG